MNTKCLVMQMQDDGRLPAPGRHRAHPAHDWWYISSGGGHQMDTEPTPDDPDSRNATKHTCPGRTN